MKYNPYITSMLQKKTEKEICIGMDSKEIIFFYCTAVGNVTILQLQQHSILKF